MAFSKKARVMRSKSGGSRKRQYGKKPKQHKRSLRGRGKRISSKRRRYRKKRNSRKKQKGGTVLKSVGIFENKSTTYPPPWLSDSQKTTGVILKQGSFTKAAGRKANPLYASSKKARELAPKAGSLGKQPWRARHDIGADKQPSPVLVKNLDVVIHLKGWGSGDINENGVYNTAFNTTKKHLSDILLNKTSVKFVIDGDGGNACYIKVFNKILKELYDNADIKENLPKNIIIQSYKDFKDGEVKFPLTDLKSGHKHLEIQAEHYKLLNTVLSGISELIKGVEKKVKFVYQIEIIDESTHFVDVPGSNNQTLIDEIIKITDKNNLDIDIDNLDLLKDYNEPHRGITNFDENRYTGYLPYEINTKLKSFSLKNNMTGVLTRADLGFNPYEYDNEIKEPNRKIFIESVKETLKDNTFDKFVLIKKIKAKKNNKTGQDHALKGLYALQESCNIYGKENVRVICFGGGGITLIEYMYSRLFDLPKFKVIGNVFRKRDTTEEEEKEKKTSLSKMFDTNGNPVKDELRFNEGIFLNKNDEKKETLKLFFHEEPLTQTKEALKKHVILLSTHGTYSKSEKKLKRLEGETLSNTGSVKHTKKAAMLDFLVKQALIACSEIPDDTDEIIVGYDGDSHNEFADITNDNCFLPPPTQLLILIIQKLLEKKIDINKIKIGQCQRYDYIQEFNIISEDKYLTQGMGQKLTTENISKIKQILNDSAKHINIRFDSNDSSPEGSDRIIKKPSELSEPSELLLNIPIIRNKKYDYGGFNTPNEPISSTAGWLNYFETKERKGNYNLTYLISWNNSLLNEDKLGGIATYEGSITQSLKDNIVNYNEEQKIFKEVNIVGNFPVS